MSVRQQRGYSTIATVVMALLAGLWMLNGLNQQLRASLMMVADETRFIQQFNDALSALAWGQTLSWGVHAGWSCQQEKQSHFQVCLLQDAHMRLLLLAYSTLSPDSVRLYRWVTRDNNQIKALEHGWIDLCPLSVSSQCEPLL